MFLFVGAGHKDVVNIGDDTRKALKNSVNRVLTDCRSAMKAERKLSVSKSAYVSQ